MRQPLVIGNWKMNGSSESISALLSGVVAGLGESDGAKVAVCPSFVYIPSVIAQLQGEAIEVGAQNVAEQQSGAFTGEISVAMLKDIGCRYVIVGHSERRALFAESDVQVARKFIQVKDAGLLPVLCVGENLAERESGQALAVIEAQLQAVLTEAGAGCFESAVVAYEPIWAIGTGKTATPEQAQEVHKYVRDFIARESKSTADKLQILYGGSVKAANAAELFAQQDIDGALVGGAALSATEFVTICKATNK
ncbi:triosephosphate isomerase [Sinobacterium caligoides]|uniref:Triosephosphate isomerase n=1 Tax=Sinobacterium caligoides TaxID=933926 RepID=A0A3N2DFR9_9GAMM|nr:triose-phosphate isomerase [Sinobacterium caligoides]ROR98646.1 triosephosphate isomerase [Sinobacterium caligoides]